MLHACRAGACASLVGEGGSRLGLTVRADIPPVEHGSTLARGLAGKVITDRPSGVVAVVVSEAPDGVRAETAPDPRTRRHPHGHQRRAHRRKA